LQSRNYGAHCATVCAALITGAVLCSSAWARTPTPAPDAGPAPARFAEPGAVKAAKAPAAAPAPADDRAADERSADAAPAPAPPVAPGERSVGEPPCEDTPDEENAEDHEHGEHGEHGEHEDTEDDGYGEDVEPEGAPAAGGGKRGGKGKGDADCVSVGKASAGWLINGVRLESSKRILARSDTNWGTPEVIKGIKAAVEAVHARFPKTPRLVVGDISKKGGGRLRPHRSHQSGRDADIGYFLKTPQTSNYFQSFDVSELDVPRTWAFVASLLASGGVQYIFIDRAIQAPLRAHAEKRGKLTKGKLDVLFSSRSGKKGHDTIIRHARGHRNHMHVRFRAEASVQAAQVWIENGGAKKLKPVAVQYTVREGDNLGRIAKRKKTTVAKLLEWNKISPTKLLKIGQKLIVGYAPPRL
jgi:hypothetical protein